MIEIDAVHLIESGLTDASLKALIGVSMTDAIYIYTVKYHARARFLGLESNDEPGRLASILRFLAVRE